MEGLSRGEGRVLGRRSHRSAPLPISISTTSVDTSLLMRGLCLVAASVHNKIWMLYVLHTNTKDNWSEDKMGVSRIIECIFVHQLLYITVYYITVYHITRVFRKTLYACLLSFRGFGYVRQILNRAPGPLF